MHGFISGHSILHFLCQDYTLLITVALWYSLKVREPDPFNSVFLSQDALAIRGRLCFHTNCKNFWSNSVKNAIGSLIGIALNL